MKSYHLLTTLAAAILTFNVAFAQPGGEGHDRPDFKNMTAAERADFKTARLTESLQLSDEQTATISTANLEMEQEMDELRKQFDDLKARKKDLKKAHREKLKNVLTEEQQAKLKEMHKEMRDRKHMQKHREMERMKHELEEVDEDR